MVFLVAMPMRLYDYEKESQFGPVVTSPKRLT
jgi:hypothetical protein